MLVERLLTVVIGLLGGIAVGIQSPLVGAIGQRVGAASSSFVLHFMGALVSLPVLLLRGEHPANLLRLPWWMYLSGALGLVLVFTVNYTIPRIGAAGAITLIIVGQLVMGLLIDQFGLLGSPVRPIDPTRVVAAGLLLAGAYLMVR